MQKKVADFRSWHYLNCSMRLKEGNSLRYLCVRLSNVCLSISENMARAFVGGQIPHRSCLIICIWKHQACTGNEHLSDCNNNYTAMTRHIWNFGGNTSQAGGTADSKYDSMPSSLWQEQHVMHKKDLKFSLNANVKLTSKNSCVWDQLKLSASCSKELWIKSTCRDTYCCANESTAWHAWW